MTVENFILHLDRKYRKYLNREGKWLMGFINIVDGSARLRPDTKMVFGYIRTELMAVLPVEIKSEIREILGAPKNAVEF